MAKCIKYLSNETMARVSDDDALAIVLSDAAMYTSKGAYHAWLGNEDKARRAEAARLGKIDIGWQPPARKERKSRKQRSHKWN
jgi:hypothetical protein